MIKRELRSASEQAVKRQKLDIGAEEQVQSAQHLRQLLTFQQDAVPQLRSGVKNFKLFLESLLYNEDKSSTIRQQSLLKDFLEQERPKDDTSTFLPALLQAWSFAAQTNNESLLSAVPAVLALLLRTLSSMIQFRDLGLLLGKSVLQQSQLSLIGRALGAPKQKGHVISPCIRLLTEVVLFDGGALCRQVFEARSITLDGKVLARNLSLGASAGSSQDSSQRAPSVRSNTVRYLLANLRLQSTAAKIELLKSSPIFRALFEFARQDSPETMRNIFSTITTHVVLDDAIPRRTKAFIFNDRNLANIAALYRSDLSTEDHPEAMQPDKTAHAFLKTICTTPSAGILNSPASFYPPGTDRAAFESGAEKDSSIELGLDAIEWYDTFRAQIPVRNTVLSNFAQSLRPYSNLLESDLLLSILGAAPELVADYFLRKSNFSFDPKLTATWIGYSAFLFAALKLPIPKYFGCEDFYRAVPPPVSILLESLLPQPTSQKILTRCLNQQSDLITFFAIRLLVVAFQKLKQCLAMFEEAMHTHGDLWREGAIRLRVEFSSRCPNIKDVIAAFRKSAENHPLQHEASLRLLLLYHQVLPEVALQEKFDISVPLNKALEQQEVAGSRVSEATNDKDSSDLPEGFNMIKLNHLLQIARLTPETRWWSKPESLHFTPLTSLLRLVARRPSGTLPHAIWNLLSSIFQGYDMLQKHTKVPALQALIVSLSPDDRWTPDDVVFEWLDDVLARNIKKPIKYLDDLDHHKQGHDSKGLLSPIWMTLLEQWPFAAKRDGAAQIAEWITRFSLSCEVAGEDIVLLRRIRTSMATEEAFAGILNAATPKNWKRKDVETALASKTSISEERAKTELGESSKSLLAAVETRKFAPPDDGEDGDKSLHTALSQDIETASKSGSLSALLLCLSSSDVDIRTQALKHVFLLRNRLPDPALDTSNSPSAALNASLKLLLGIVANTASPARLPAASGQPGTIQEQPFPRTLSVFASLAVLVIADPLHVLHSDINKFLTRAPAWKARSVISYWVDRMLRSPPTETLPFSATVSSGTHSYKESAPLRRATALDESRLRFLPLTTAFQVPDYPSSPHHTGIQFLLSMLYHALASPSDLNHLRSANALEPILALTSVPFLPLGLKELVLSLVWRATAIEGGSTTLMTRAGAVAWADGLCAEHRDAKEGMLSDHAVRELVARLWETCDHKHVSEWSAGRMESLVQVS